MSKKISDVVSFRNDLFFGGAASISWLETDRNLSDIAATNFVFHGPEYHGVFSDDLRINEDYPIIDTASFTLQILETFDSENSANLPISLAIAGYGSGKSHLALTLATLLSTPASKVSETIVNNLCKAADTVGFDVKRILKKWGKPFLTIAINGMKNFDLANELSRQALLQLKIAGLDSGPIDELWPRFSLAIQFVERNHVVRKAEFEKRFPGASTKSIMTSLLEHDENTFLKVNEIFEIANGYPIRSIGQESPQQLISTLCDHYCGDSGHFQGVFIAFDEFGRYVEFAADRPHIAGDAALQQLFEGIQDNSDKSFLVCFTQYELKLHLARVASEKQTSIQRYVGRYDTAKKYHLSCNLETIFAHLIEKRDEKYLEANLSSTENAKAIQNSHQQALKWLSGAEQIHVWKDYELFRKVVSVGCWPVQPLAIWFLTRLDNLFQSRSALTFVRNAIDSQSEKSVPNFTWPIYATDICKEDLIQELIAAEEYGRRGTIAQSFSIVEQKYAKDLAPNERKALTAVLVHTKMGMTAENRDDGISALSALSGISHEMISKAVNALSKQYGVLEWDDRFKRFEILAYSVPRSAFTQLLRKKTQDITDKQIQEIFSNNMKAWSDLKDVYPDFANENGITTSEWFFDRQWANLRDLPQTIESAVTDLTKAYRIDSSRGKLIHCYFSQDYQIDHAKGQVSKLLDQALKNGGQNGFVPLIVMVLHDEDGTLAQLLAEYYIVTQKLDQNETEKFRHFIDDHKENLSTEIKSQANALLSKMHYVLPNGLKSQPIRISKMCQHVFEQCYPKIVPFRFDGFSSHKGSAPKDCRSLQVELFKGNLDAEWIQAQPAQTQNRATSLLGHGYHAWRILGDDGKVQLYPSNPKLKEIYSIFEQKLKQHGKMNLEDCYSILVKAPYGLNLASAGLVIGAFLCPRIGSISYLHRDETISSSVFVNELLSRNYLNVDKLADYDVFFVPDNLSGEWEELLAKWDMEQSYSQKLLFMQNAQQLQTRIKLPAGLLFEKYKRLSGKTEEAAEAIQRFENSFEQLVRYFEGGVRKKSSKRAIKTAYEMTNLLKTMMETEECWSVDQIKKVETLINEAKQSAVQFFDSWLNEQGCMDALQLVKFSSEMDALSKHFKALKLADLATRIENHKIAVVRNIEDIQKLKYAVDEAEAFTRSIHIGPSTTIMKLNEIRDTAINNIQNLERARQRKNLSAIEACLKSTEKIKADAQDEINKHKHAFGALFDASPRDFEHLYEIKSEVDRLSEIFLGADVDVEDLHTMRRQIDLLIADKKLFDNYTFTNQELKKAVATRIKDLTAKQDPDNPPPWDTEEIFHNFLKVALQQRTSMAEKWTKENLLTNAEIGKLGPEDCVAHRRFIQNAPCYLDDKQLKKIKIMREQLDKRLDEHEVEGMLVMFRRLTPKQQAEFYQILQKELAGKN